MDRGGETAVTDAVPAAVFRGRREVLCRKGVVAGWCLLVVMFSAFMSGAAAERIKDIASIEGVRDNQLIGYGIVVGLNGSGDKSRATLQSVTNMLARMGVTVSAKDIKAKNTAAVIVTATLPPFPKIGNRIDAVVSALGDAKSLQGGTLLLTPLKGADGRIYGIAQGPVSIGGFSAGGGGTTTQKNHPTVGKVPGGVTIEREIAFDIAAQKEINIYLHSPDFTTATSVSRAVNAFLGHEYARAEDPSKVVISIPEEFRGRVVDFIGMIETVDVEVDIPARVIINERTGTVVITRDVKISPVAISHGGLTVEISTEQMVSQPPPFGPESSRTVVVPRTDVSVREQKASLIPLSGVSLNDVVKGLNMLGVTPRDLISILQALKAAGALRAELEII